MLNQGAMTFCMIRKILTLIALIVLVPLLVFGSGLAPINLAWLKADISDAVASRLGLDLQLRGDLEIRLGPQPVLSASDLVLNNPAEGNRPLSNIAQLSAKPRLMALLRGDLLLRDLAVTGLTIDYCQRQFPSSAPPDSSPGEPGEQAVIALDRLQVSGIQAQCYDPGRSMDWIPDRLELAGALPRGGPAEAVLEGAGERSFSLSFSGESLSEWLAQPEDYAFSATLRVPDTVDLALDARSAVNALDVARLDGSIGGLPFSLSGRVKNLLARPELEIDVHVEQLSLDLLATLPGPGGEDTFESLDLQPAYEFLAGFDADMKVTAGQVLDGPFPVEGLTIKTTLQDRVLAASADASVLEGTALAATLSLDMRANCADLHSSFQANDVRLMQLNPFLGNDGALGGKLQGIRIETESCGAAVTDHLDTLQAALTLEGLSAQWDDNPVPIVVRSLQSTFGWRQPGLLTLESDFLGEAFSATAKVGSLDALLSGSRWPISAHLSALDSKLSVHGDMVLAENARELNLDAELEVPQVGTLQPWTGQNPGNELPLMGRARLEAGSDGFSIKQLDVRLGASDFRGKLDWTDTGASPSIRADLDSGVIDLVELDSLAVHNPDLVPAESEGLSSTPSQFDWIEKWLDLPAIEILLSVGQLRGFLTDAGDIRLQARLDDRIIENAQLEFLLGDLRFDGSLDANLRNRPWSLSFNSVLTDIDLGHLLTLLGAKRKIDASASRAEFQIDSEGHSLNELVENARTDYAIDDFRWEFTSGPENQRHELELASLAVSSSLRSQTTWQTSGLINRVPFTAVMHSPPLRNTFGGRGPLPITLAIGTGMDIMMLDANLQRNSSEIQHIDVSISGENGSESMDLTQLEPPLSGYEVKTRIRMQDNQLSFAGLEARTGSSDLKGDFRISYENPGYGFDLDLHSDSIETEDLVPWVVKWRESRRTATDDQAPEPGEAEHQEGLFALIAANIQELAGENRIHASLVIDQLISAGKPLGEARFGMEIDENGFRFDPVSIELLDGHARVSLSGQDQAAGYEYLLNTDISNLEYGGLLRLVDPETEAGGILFLDIEMTAQPPDSEQIASYLQGHLDMAAIPRNADAAFLDLWASNLVFALLPAQEDSGKKMNCMVAHFDVENGVMKTNQTFLDSTEVIVRARGTVDLHQRELDLVVAPQAKREKFFSVSTPVTVTGPFDDPEIEMAPGGFIMTMVRWYYGLVYVPWKWLTGERFPPDGIATCYNAMSSKLQSEVSDHPQQAANPE
jgi:hypothetical protein